jgi:hypothetical protein
VSSESVFLFLAHTSSAADFIHAFANYLPCSVIVLEDFRNDFAVNGDGMFII